jgi:hypothetical protein
MESLAGGLAGGIGDRSRRAGKVRSSRKTHAPGRDGDALRSESGTAELADLVPSRHSIVNRPNIDFDISLRFHL